MDLFQLIGDLLHLLAVIALPIKIWTSKNVAGVSGVTQIFYSLVFTTRYLDLFFFSFISVDDTDIAMKITFISTAYLTVYLIYVKFKDRDSQSCKEDSSWIMFWTIICIAVIFSLINHHYNRNQLILEIPWAFSIYLEAMAIIPQLVMVFKIKNKSGEIQNFIFYYIFLMSFYGEFHVLHWMYRYIYERHYDRIAILGGVAQVSIYIAFPCYIILSKLPFCGSEEKVVDVKI
ncbi:ER lumen protein-retaining receptor 2-like [Planococcus citri]|uniref:ER lumen protein-retaining receptor 2-like n=1 Tax=Planococcus citri TaxID=170843 RepID=UPI0031F93D17